MLIDEVLKLNFQFILKNVDYKVNYEYEEEVLERFFL